MAGNRGDELVVAGMRPQSFLGTSNPYDPVHRGTVLILFIDSLIPPLCDLCTHQHARIFDGTNHDRSWRWPPYDELACVSQEI